MSSFGGIFLPFLVFLGGINGYSTKKESNTFGKCCVLFLSFEYSQDILAFLKKLLKIPQYFPSTLDYQTLSYLTRIMWEMLFYKYEVVARPVSGYEDYKKFKQ